MDKSITVVFYTDPGHGWLQVPKHLAKELAIKPSVYSYQDREYLYLEEDFDAQPFFSACDAKGITYNVKSQHTDGQSFIRNLRPYS